MLLNATVKGYSSRLNPYTILQNQYYTIENEPEAFFVYSKLKGGQMKKNIFATQYTFLIFFFIAKFI